VPASPTGRHVASGGWLSREALTAKTLLYVSDSAENTVFVYNPARKHQAPIGQLTDDLQYPDGMVTDAQGNLYIANGAFPKSPDVVFAPGGVSPFRKLAGFGPNFPSHDDIAVGNDGTVYVMSLCCLQAVAVFPKGATKPAYYIDFDTVANISIALDAKDNLYLCFCVDLHCTSTQIEEFPPGSHGSGKNLGISLVHGEGMRFDSSGNLVVVDAGVPVIDVFPPGKTMPKFQFGRNGYPSRIAFDRDKARLYVVDSIVVGIGPNQVDVYDYPSGTLVDTIPGFPSSHLRGVALVPAPPL
jgi:DNA-binding beta-propeller fold protein YncE